MSVNQFTKVVENLLLCPVVTPITHEMVTPSGWWSHLDTTAITGEIKDQHSLGAQSDTLNKI